MTDELQIGSVFIKTAQGHTVNADPDSRDAVGNAEATRDPIFLLQKRMFSAVNGEELNDSQYYHDGDSLWISATCFDNNEIKKAKKEERWLASKDSNIHLDCITITEDEIYERGWAIYHWQTESVWFRREEAEAWAKSQKYNLGKLGKDCRVYCVCAEGRLASILKVVHNKEIEKYLRSQSFRMDYAGYRKMMETKIGGSGA